MAWTEWFAVRLCGTILLLLVSGYKLGTWTSITDIIYSGRILMTMKEHEHSTVGLWWHWFYGLTFQSCAPVMLGLRLSILRSDYVRFTTRVFYCARIIPGLRLVLWGHVLFSLGLQSSRLAWLLNKDFLTPSFRFGNDVWRIYVYSDPFSRINFTRPA